MNQLRVSTLGALIVCGSLLVACGSSSSGSTDAASATGAGGAAGTGGSGAGATGGTSAAGAGGTGMAGVGGTGTAGAGGTGTSGKGGTAGAGTGGGTAGKGGTGSSGKGGSGGSGTAGSGMAGAGGSMLAAACDPMAQTGCKAPQKCVAVGTNTSDTTSACADPGAGPPVTKEGADCMRTSLGVADNCAPGLICTVRGVLDADSTNKHTQCRKFCMTSTDCADNQLCDQFTQDGFGVCINACVPFTPCDPISQSGKGGSGGAAGGGGAAGAGGGSAPTVTCSEQYGFNEDPTKGFFGCHVVGSSNTGEPCTSGYNSKDCGVNQFCAATAMGSTMGTCTQWCQMGDPSATPPISMLDCTVSGQSCASTMPGEINICM